MGFYAIFSLRGTGLREKRDLQNANSPVRQCDRDHCEHETDDQHDPVGDDRRGQGEAAAGQNAEDPVSGDEKP